MNMNRYIMKSDQSISQNSSGGNLLKWHIANRFIKTSTFKEHGLQTEYMYESYAEVIASRLAKWLGIPSVQYQLCEIILDNGIRLIGCESTDFMNTNTSKYRYISLGNLIALSKFQYTPGIPGYKQLIAWIEPSVPGFKNYLDANLLLDYIVINDDRHLNNLGLLRDTITGKFAVAPIFDTGNSLFCHKHIGNILYEPTLPSVLQAKPFHPNFDIQLKLADTSILKPNKNISRYINTLLRNLEAQGLPKYRSEFIHDLLKDRLSSIGIFK